MSQSSRKVGEMPTFLIKVSSVLSELYHISVSKAIVYGVMSWLPHALSVGLIPPQKKKECGERAAPARRTPSFSGRQPQAASLLQEVRMGSPGGYVSRRRGERMRSLSFMYQERLVHQSSLISKALLRSRSKSSSIWRASFSL